jgi:hypothetical protein
VKNSVFVALRMEGICSNVSTCPSWFSVNIEIDFVRASFYHYIKERDLVVFLNFLCELDVWMLRIEPYQSCVDFSFVNFRENIIDVSQPNSKE